MNSKLLTLLVLLCSTLIASAHAESYNFSDTGITIVPEYTGYSGGTPADVTNDSINVSGTTGTITDLNVTISGISSQALYDMTFVLVGPDSTGVVLSSFAGGDTSDSFITPLNLTFDDEADKEIASPNNWNQVYRTETESGTYQTSANSLGKWYMKNNYGAYAVEDPVAAGYFGDTSFTEDNLLSAFDDISANGVWSLLAYDNLADDRTLFSGWSLNFTTSAGSASAVPEPAEWALLLLATCAICCLHFYRSRSSARA